MENKLIEIHGLLVSIKDYMGNKSDIDEYSCPNDEMCFYIEIETAIINIQKILKDTNIKLWKIN